MVPGRKNLRSLIEFVLQLLLESQKDLATTAPTRNIGGSNPPWGTKSFVFKQLRSFVEHSTVNYTAEHNKPLFWRRLAIKLSPLFVPRLCRSGCQRGVLGGSYQSGRLLACCWLRCLHYFRVDRQPPTIRGGVVVKWNSFWQEEAPHHPRRQLVPHRRRHWRRGR